MLVSVSVPAGVCKALFACVISPSSIVLHLQVVFDCLALHGIASRLRAGRFASGALRLTNTRLSFALDTGGNPVLASPYVQVGLESRAGGSSCSCFGSNVIGMSSGTGAHCGCMAKLAA
jgi:hypothetical protein